MALDPSEAQALASALIELDKHYPTQVPPEALAWFNVISVAGMIYGSRIMAVRMRRNTERRGPPSPTDGIRKGGPQAADIRQATGEVAPGGASFRVMPEDPYPFAASSNPTPLF